MKLSGDIVNEVRVFKICSIEEWYLEEDKNYKFKCGWMKWKQELGVLCDRRIPIR